MSGEGGVDTNADVNANVNMHNNSSLTAASCVQLGLGVWENTYQQGASGGGAHTSVLSMLLHAHPSTHFLFIFLNKHQASAKLKLQCPTTCHVGHVTAIGRSSFSHLPLFFNITQGVSVQVVPFPLLQGSFLCVAVLFITPPLPPAISGTPLPPSQTNEGGK